VYVEAVVLIASVITLLLGGVRAASGATMAERVNEFETAA
jgi:hypothetical protein